MSLERVEMDRATSATAIEIAMSSCEHAAKSEPRTKFDVPATGQSVPSPDALLLSRRFAEFANDHLVHAFTYRGKCLLVDPVSGVVFRLTEQAAAAAMALCQTSNITDRALQIESAGAAHAINLFNDLVRLGTEGLFRRASLSHAERHEQAVEAYLDHHPRKMMLLVSQTCNLRCVYCYAIEGNFHDEGRMMTLHTAQDAIRFLARRSGPRKNLTVTLFGGEPLLNFSMVRKLVPWAASWVRTVGKSIHFCITTNGMLLTEDAIDFLIQNQFSIMLSFDGPQAVQDAARPTAGGKGSFAAVAPRFKRLLERHPHPEAIVVRTTMTHQSHDLIELSKFFEDFGFRRIGLGSTIGYAFHKGPYDLTAVDRNEIDAKFDHLLDVEWMDAIRTYRRLPYNPIVPSLLSLHDERERVGVRVKLACGAGRNDQGVDVDGRLYPCHRYVGMSSYAIGDIWHGVDQGAVESFYRRLLSVYGKCEGCWATRWCAGACPRYVSQPSGEIAEPDSDHCDGVRRSVERSLAIEVELDAENIDWARLRRDVSND